MDNRWLRMACVALAPLVASVGCSSVPEGELLAMGGSAGGQQATGAPTPDGGSTASSGGAAVGTAGVETTTSTPTTMNEGQMEPDNMCGAIKEKTELVRDPVDVVIALDSSGSMTAEICNVSQNLTAFADGVGPDTRVVAAYQIGIELFFQFVALCQKEDPLAGTTLASDAQRYQRVDVQVDSNNALQVLLDTYDGYADFLRPGSPTHFIVVSDDESSLGAEEFKMQMEAKLGHGFYLHAIVATGNGCGGANVGTQYLNLADQTGGEKLSICETDWTGLFARLEEAVARSAPLPCGFDIPPAPAGQKFSPDRVSVSFTPPTGGTMETVYPRASSVDACGDQAGWHFDDEMNPTRIEFCPVACEEVKQGGEIGIAFGCKPPMII